MANQRRVTTPAELYKGDTHEPLSFRLTDAQGNGRDLEGKDVEIIMLTVTDDTGEEPIYSATPKIARTASNVTVEPVKSFTVDTTNNWILCDNHGFQDGWEVKFDTSGTKPTGLTDDGFFVIEAYKNRFKVAQYEGGDAVDISSSGTSPEVYALGHVQYAWQSANVDTAGQFGFWAFVIDGSNEERCPPDEFGIRVSIDQVATA